MKILFIDIDTLRADHMSCYGYLRNTTPRMDEVAKESVCFTNYYCSDAPCLPSRSALVSGEFGIHNGITGHGGTAADRIRTGCSRGFTDSIDENNFHNLFRKKGMYTASISTFAERHSAWWFNGKFNETYNVGDGGLESGEKVHPYIEDWLERNKNREDWFLHVHFWDPHTPYRAPADFGNPFENEPFDDWIDEAEFQKHLKKSGPHSVNELYMFNDHEMPELPRTQGKIKTRADIKKVIDGYDCGIAYTDYLVGKIFDILKKQDVYDQTAIIITSDHGENMGELGIYSEHGTADQPTCNIPLIVKWKGCKKGHTDTGLHYNIDLVPTIADLLDLPHAPNWDGQSFAPALLKGENCGREYLILSQMAHVVQRSCRWGDYLYIKTVHDGYHLFDDEMLFNLAEDPHEKNNIAKERPDLCAYGARYIFNWQIEMMRTSKDRIDPMWTVLAENGPYHTWGELPAYLTRLEQTGRSEAAKKLRERYSKR